MLLSVQMRQLDTSRDILSRMFAFGKGYKSSKISLDQKEMHFSLYFLVISEAKRFIHSYTDDVKSCSIESNYGCDQSTNCGDEGKCVETKNLTIGSNTIIDHVGPVDILNEFSCQCKLGCERKTFVWS